MAEWLRPGLWEVLTIKLCGIQPELNLVHKEVYRGGMVLKLRPVVTMAGMEHIFRAAG